MLNMTKRTHFPAYLPQCEGRPTTWGGFRDIDIAISVLSGVLT